MQLYNILLDTFAIGTAIAQFFIGAAFGGAIPMVAFFFTKRVLFGLLCLPLCGLVSLFSFPVSVACGIVLTVTAVILYIIEKNQEKKAALEQGDESQEQWTEEPSPSAEPSENAENASFEQPTANKPEEFRTEIAGWVHRIKRYPDGHINVWHHVTESEKKLGTEVRFDLPADYFSSHTAEDLYEFTADHHICVYGNKDREIEALNSKLVSMGWIKE